LKVYGIRNCDTMKKAFAWLESRGIKYDFHDYKKDGVPPGKLQAWSKQVGWQKLANTRGPTWRKLGVKDPTEARTLALLEENTSAIRRPIVEAGGKLLIGFDEAAFAKALKP
jgi:arsenate reductase (glutaredoxin)